jgi:hypothetical protein
MQLLFQLELPTDLFEYFYIGQIDKDIAKAFSNKPTIKKIGIAATPQVVPGANQPEPIKGAQKGNIEFHNYCIVHINLTAEQTPMLS